MDIIGLQQGVNVGEASTSYGYFTFKISKRNGYSGILFANDITI